MIVKVDATYKNLETLTLPKATDEQWPLFVPAHSCISSLLSLLFGSIGGPHLQENQEILITKKTNYMPRGMGVKFVGKKTQPDEFPNTRTKVSLTRTDSVPIKWVLRRRHIEQLWYDNVILSKTKTERRSSTLWLWFCRWSLIKYQFNSLATC